MVRSTLLRRDRVGRPPATILARRRESTFSDFILIKAQQFEMKNRNAQEPIQNDNRRRELRKLWLQMPSKGPPASENGAKHSPSTRQGRPASGNDFGQASRIDIFWFHFDQGPEIRNEESKRARTHSEWSSKKRVVQTMISNAFKRSVHYWHIAVSEIWSRINFGKHELITIKWQFDVAGPVKLFEIGTLGLRNELSMVVEL